MGRITSLLVNKNKHKLPGKQVKGIVIHLFQTAILLFIHSFIAMPSDYVDDSYLRIQLKFMCLH